MRETGKMVDRSANRRLITIGRKKKLRFQCRRITVIIFADIARRRVTFCAVRYAGFACYTRAAIFSSYVLFNVPPWKRVSSAGTIAGEQWQQHRQQQMFRSSLHVFTSAIMRLRAITRAFRTADQTFSTTTACVA